MGGADSNSESNERYLHEAASRGSLNICSALLDAGVNVNITDEDKKTWRGYESALGAAVRSNHFSTAELLLQRGADVNDEDCDDMSPLDEAEGNTQMIDLLIAFGAEDKKDYFKMSRLVEEGKIKECAALIQQGFDVNTQGGRYQRSMLQLAAAAGQREICLLLLNHRAEPNLGDNRGFTPLSVTAENGHSEIFLDLIKAGADCIPFYSTARDDSYSYILGWGDLSPTESLLHIAAKYGQTEICRILIEECKMPVDINRISPSIGASPENKTTPLMLAVSYMQEETCIYLIKKGANVNAKDECGTPVLVFASSKSLDDDMDEDADNDLADFYYESLSGNAQKRICKMLLKSGAKINLMMPEGSVLSALLKGFHDSGKLDGKILDMTIPRALTLEKYNAETQKIEMFDNPSDGEYKSLRLKVLFLLLVLKKCGLMERGLRFEILIRAEEFCSAAVTTALHRITKYKSIEKLPTQLFKPISNRIYANTITDIGNILKDTGHDMKALEMLHGEKIRENIQRTFQLK